MKSRSAAGAAAPARIAPLLRTVREPRALDLRLPAVLRDAVLRDAVFLAVFLDAVFLDAAVRPVFRALFREPPREALLLREALDLRAPPRPLLFRELADFREPRLLPALTPRGGISLLREHALAAKLLQARTKPPREHACAKPAVSKPVERRRLA
jgi:hypothetical protein